MNAELVDRVVPVLLFLAGATVLAGLVGAAGVFDAAAVRAARLAAGRPWALLGLVALLATVTTGVLSLDTTAVLVTPVALSLARQLGVSPWPYAFSTVWLAGTASLLLPVSNLTNLLAADRLGGTAAFVTRSAPVWAVSVAVTLAVLALTSRRELRGRYVVPPVGSPADRLLFRAAVVAVAVFAALVLAELPAWVAAAVAAVPLAVLARVRRAGVRPLALVPWVLIAGVVALFTVVTVAGPHGLDRVLADVAGTGGGLRLSATAALGGNLVDNLPPTGTRSRCSSASTPARCSPRGARWPRCCGPGRCAPRAWRCRGARSCCGGWCSCRPSCCSRRRCCSRRSVP